MYLQFYRFFLNAAQQMELFQDGEKKSKHDILSEIWGEKFAFNNRGTDLAYVSHAQVEDYIFGSLGKKSKLIKSLPPEKEFEEKEEEHWPHSKMYINISDDSEKGQMIAVEINKGVFEEPLNQLRALQDKINETLTPKYGYVMSINPISHEAQFWDFVDTYKGNIKEVTFHYRSPNLFGLENALNDELKEAKELLNATSSCISFKNEEGNLKVPKTEIMEQSVQYIAEGGGEYKIKVKGLKSPITNTKKIKSKNLEQELNIDITVADKETFKHVFDTIFS